LIPTVQEVFGKQMNVVFLWFVLCWKWVT
jgi:hypothetical protein